MQKQNDHWEQHYEKSEHRWQKARCPTFLACTNCGGSCGELDIIFAQWAVPLIYTAVSVEDWLESTLSECQGSIDPETDSNGEVQRCNVTETNWETGWDLCVRKMSWDKEVVPWAMWFPSQDVLAFFLLAKLQLAWVSRRKSGWGWDEWRMQVWFFEMLLTIDKHNSWSLWMIAAIICIGKICSFQHNFWLQIVDVWANFQVMFQILVTRKEALRSVIAGLNWKTWPANFKKLHISSTLMLFFPLHLSLCSCFFRVIVGADLQNPNWAQLW